MNERIARYQRKTAETEVEVVLGFGGSGQAAIRTRLGFLDHMLTSWARHAGLDLELVARGDLEVDDHHCVEDCAIALGRAFATGLDGFRGVRRFASAYAPLDEALARVVLDLSGRPFADVDLGLSRERLGDVATENLDHFFRSFAMEARVTLHVDVLKGRNDHHRVEAAFKAFALATREAVIPTGDLRVASTKEVLG
jgi:imidazoleglycerol-phosphate dehydratase